MEKNIERMQLGFNQLPQNYHLPLSRASEEKLELLTERLNKAFQNNSEGHLVFIEGTAQPIYGILRQNYPIKDVWGVNFAEYFKVTFDKTEEYSILPRKFVIIYNIGLEAAINTTFSSRLLKGIIKKLQMENCWIFLETDLSYQKFHTQYDIEVATKITIPLKRAESIL